MQIKLFLGSAALVGTALFTAAMPLQDSKPAGAPDITATIEAFKQAAVPGPQHKEFTNCVGTWTTHFKHWMDPSQPPQEGSGTSTFETIMGGRYLVEHAAGDGPMGPFEGMGLLAYNNITDQFEHVWLDDMSTGLMFASGIEGSDDSTTLKGEMVDPTTKQKLSIRTVCRRVNENERVVEMYCNQGGQEHKSMEITYTRGSTAAR